MSDKKWEKELDEMLSKATREAKLRPWQKRISPNIIPAFPTGIKTPYGWSLIRAFQIGEWQDKIYNQVQHNSWSDAKDNAEGILQIENELYEKYKIDTRRASFFMQEIINAIDKKDIRTSQELISEHDNEILSALQVAKAVSICR